MNNREHNHEAIYNSIQAKDFTVETPHDYDDLLADIRSSFEEVVNLGKGKLFITDANERSGGNLYERFLMNIPKENRQEHECRACRNFVNRYGGIVKIKDDGLLDPIMWNYAPDFFNDAIEDLHNFVKNSKVIGIFITNEKRLGTPKTGEWKHMSVDVPNQMIFNDRLKTSEQAKAEKHEDFKMMVSAINNYKTDTVKSAINLLRSDSLYRAEKILENADWFLNTITDVKKDNKINTNLLWKKVADAPAGFCHISSSMIGTLLDDIEDGLDFETVRRKFNEKMDPLHYQRPQVAPSAGNVARAEKIVAELGLANSLKRRFARLDEIKTVWKPASIQSTVESTGVFAGIKTKNSTYRLNRDDIPPVKIMTWEKFQRTVLPIAKKIEVFIALYRNSYAAIVTAEDRYAPPIIRWDSEEHRNPFSWYMYANGSYPYNWNLPSDEYVEVKGVALQPNLWQPGFEHLGNGVIFILKDCKDANNKTLNLFPELLRSELREVRSTIEAYSKRYDLTGYEEASACGLCLQSSNKSWKCQLRVTTDVGVSMYNLDRWD